MRLFSLSIAFGLILSQLSVYTASADWQTVSSSILDMNLFAGAAAGPDGTLYALGFTYRANTPVTWVLGSSSDLGKTWQQLDRFLYSSTTFSEPSAFYLSKAGDLYEAGYVQDKNTVRWVIRERQAGGSFATVLDKDIGSAAFCMGPTGITEDASGRIAVVGCAKIPEQPSSTTVIMTSADRGTTWSNADILAPPSSVPLAVQTGCRGNALSFQGANLLVAQSCAEIGGQTFPTEFWTEVSMSSDYGKTWQLVDRSENEASGYVSQISAITVDSTGDVFYGGEYIRDWRIRSYNKTFNSWTTADELLGTGQYTSEINSLFVDPVTNQVWATGNIDNNGGIWTTRTSTDQGMSWTNSDQFQSGTSISEGAGIVETPKGEIFVFGQVARSSVLLRSYTPPASH